MGLLISASLGLSEIQIFSPRSDWQSKSMYNQNLHNYNKTKWYHFNVYNTFSFNIS